MERNARPQGTRAFFRLLVLTALGFVLGTYEFVVVGILPEIAEGMQVSLAAVGKLVSAFAGYENTMNAYRVAVEEKYRFYSFGDSMLLL